MFHVTARAARNDHPSSNTDSISCHGKSFSKQTKAQTDWAFSRAKARQLNELDSKGK